MRSLFAIAVDLLRLRYDEAGKQRQFAIFARYDLDGPSPGGRTTYAALAVEFGVAPTDVTNWLSTARRDLREIILEKLRDLPGNDEELGEEAAALLGLRTT